MIFSVKYSQTCITSKYSSSFKQSFTRSRVPFKLLYQTYLYYISDHFIKWMQSPLNTFWGPKELFSIVFTSIKQFLCQDVPYMIQFAWCLFVFLLFFLLGYFTFTIFNLLALKQVTFHRSRVQVTAPSINYQTTQIPLDPVKHFVKA